MTDTLIAEKGARNSGVDKARIQASHDKLVELGADCAHDEAEPEAEDKTMATVSEADRDLTEDLIEVRLDESASDIGFAESGAEGWSGEVMPVDMREAGAVFNDATREIWITPIKPGFGNKRDGLYYPVETLREAVESGAFNARKMYANHPRKSDEKELPERSVRDWFATLRETVWDDQRNRPRSLLKVHDPAIYQRFKEAPEQIAFSVIGKGAARPGRVNGEQTRIVEAVHKIQSVDWVTEAGAGGAIDFAEAAQSDEEFEMDLNALTAEQLREARPDLIVALREADGDPAPEVTADVEAPDEAPEAAPAPEQFVSRAEFEAVKLELAERKVKEAVAEGRVAAGTIVDSAIRASDLPRAAREYVADHFREASLGEGLAYADEASLREAIATDIASMGRLRDSLTGTRMPKHLGAAGGEHVAPTSLREAKEADLMERLADTMLPVAARTGSQAADPAGRALADRMADKI